MNSATTPVNAARQGYPKSSGSSGNYGRPPSFGSMKLQVSLSETSAWTNHARRRSKDQLAGKGA